ncbi:MAG: phosphatidylglycerol lysyltransferase domain-containing protein [candidate division WWE3 bacterium]|nr:phosphatidylglycerol lysyltransferase domain-containing protein [candidate division WWE3 bacterium]
MIPNFPTFKKLELSDKADIQAFTFKFPSYSDFNFLSMWTYNVSNMIEISNLFGNLVVKFQDYQSDNFFYSFLGFCNIVETIDILLDKSGSNGIENYLSLIPEDCVNKQLSELTQQFNVCENRDDFDYICSLSELSRLDGSKYHNWRNLANRFTRDTKNYQVDVVDITNSKAAIRVESLFEIWEESRHKKLLHESIAIKRLLQDAKSFNNLVSTGIYVESELIAWGVCEIINKECAIGHYRKADAKYPGIFQFLEQQIALNLINYGVEYLNFEQDFGIPGLRHYKESLRPVSFLKKYTISKK